MRLGKRERAQLVAKNMRQPVEMRRGLGFRLNWDCMFPVGEPRPDWSWNGYNNRRIARNKRTLLGVAG